jgi:hypothetical protein
VSCHASKGPRHTRGTLLRQKSNSGISEKDHFHAERRRTRRGGGSSSTCGSQFGPRRRHKRWLSLMKMPFSRSSHQTSAVAHRKGSRLAQTGSGARGGGGGNSKRGSRFVSRRRRKRRPYLLELPSSRALRLRLRLPPGHVEKAHVRHKQGAWGAANFLKITRRKGVVLPSSRSFRWNFGL